MYYEDDFYNKPNEFDEMMYEFKQSIAKAVKEEFITEMNRLEKENAELQEVKDNFESIKSEYMLKIQELKRQESELKNKVRRERLSELMKEFEVVLYRADTEYVQKPKCNKCNDKRRINFTSPSGKEMYEMCECSEKDKMFKPEKMVCTEFRIKNDKSKMLMWYKMRSNDDYDWAEYSFSTLAETLYDENMDFEGVNNKTFFKSEEDCQRYCDWLNKKEV